MAPPASDERIESLKNSGEAKEPSVTRYRVTIDGRIYNVEIDDPRAGFGEEDVAGFQVPVDDPGGVDVDEGLGCSSGDGQHRVLIQWSVGYCFAKRGPVNELGGHPRLGCVHVSGQEPGGELAADPHAEFDLTAEPVTERGVGGQSGMDDLDGGKFTVFVFVSAEVDGSKRTGSKVGKDLIAADFTRV